MVHDKTVEPQQDPIWLEPMEEKHLDQVMEIETRSFSSPWSRSAYLYELTNNDFAHYIIFKRYDRILGYAGMWVILDDSHVTTLAVHPDYRGLGLGRIIMLELMRRSIPLGATRITLEVRNTNLAARRLYISLGFVEKGLRKKYYADTNEDAIIMWADLVPGRPWAGPEQMSW